MSYISHLFMIALAGWGWVYAKYMALFDRVFNLLNCHESSDHVDGSAVCKERLGGPLKYYYREAAELF